jgi:hypothetical protein
VLRANHVEGCHITKGNLPGLERLHEISVYNFWAAARRQTEHERALGCRSKCFYAFYAEISMVPMIVRIMKDARIMYCAIYLEAWSALSLMISLLGDD